MKLRTSLAAAATATAVMVSGAAVADAAPTVNDTEESRSKDSGDSGKNNDKKTIKDSLSSSDEEGSSIEDMSPEELKSWIAVVTAIIGMLTQVLSVASKFAR
ncbi:hypothetical protein HMPREF3151_05745 [Corynebacterium sp. HMSC05H05]|uniref:hypothetical protein n=1 Tax=Corynebacterium sp. HMSC05H05 TaxID=1581119 RepID=UPI0008A607DD|nr:hypothetical protein [Corynebacterium sp. HMSC05H05]OFT58298.1 hypothetical protein HMPREF3151_05745 [Corynebacterium sp. HMSC05H05]